MFHQQFRLVSSITLLLVTCLTFASSAWAAPAVSDGDIIFHTSRSAQSAAIQRATHSPYSHVGIVFHRDGKPFVFEAIATVRYTALADWIARGDGGRYVLKRLKAGPTTCTSSGRMNASIARNSCGKFINRRWAYAWERCRSCANSISPIRSSRRRCASATDPVCPSMNP